MKSGIVGKYLRPQQIGRTGDDSPASSLYGFVIRMSGWRQAVVAVLATGTAALAAAPLELQRIIIDDAIVNADVNLLAVLGGIYLAVILAQQTLKYCLRVYQGWIGESAIRYAREHLSDIYRRLGSKKSGTAVTVIGTEVDQLGAFVGQAFADPLVHGGMLLTLFGYMVFVEPVIAGVSVLFFVPQIVAVPLLQVRINHYVDNRVSMLRRLGDRVSEAEFTDLDDSQWRRYRLRLDLIHINRMRIYLLKFTSKAVVNALNALAPLSALLVGGWMVMQGDTTIGIVVAFIRGFERMADPLRDLIAFYRVAALAHVKHNRIAEWIRQTLDKSSGDEEANPEEPANAGTGNQ